MIYREQDELAALRARVEKLEAGQKRERRIARLTKVRAALSSAAPALWASGIIGIALAGIIYTAIHFAQQGNERCQRICDVRGLRFEWNDAGDGCTCSGDGALRVFWLTGEEVER